MFTQVGEKIKTCAQIFFIIGEIISVILSLIILCTSDHAARYILCMLILIIGPLISAFVSWIIYGFGVIVDTAEKEE